MKNYDKQCVFMDERDALDRIRTAKYSFKSIIEGKRTLSSRNIHLLLKLSNEIFMAQEFLGGHSPAIVETTHQERVELLLSGYGIHRASRGEDNGQFKVYFFKI